MLFLYKEIIGITAIAITIIAYIPYIRSIMSGKTKPHVFSWVIWGMVTFIVSMGQLNDGGGIGAWSISISGIFSIYVAVLAYLKKSDITITKIDWLFFITATMSILLWPITSDPLYSVLLLTIIDVCGFAPTFRKSYTNPFSEPLTFFIIMTIRNIISAIALEKYSLTTMFFPVFTGIAGLIFILMVIYRRRGCAIKEVI